jgi:hypothetical protein
MTRFEQISNGLLTHRGRDTAVRLVAYFSLFLSDLFDVGYLRIISREFSRCRLITRFFDDVPALAKLFKFHYHDSRDGKQVRAINLTSYLGLNLMY